MKLDIFQVIAINDENQIIATDRIFPLLTCINDIMIIEHSGAYCNVHKSRYCLNTQADEIFINEYGEIINFNK